MLWVKGFLFGYAGLVRDRIGRHMKVKPFLGTPRHPGDLTADMAAI